MDGTRSNVEKKSKLFLTYGTVFPKTMNRSMMKDFGISTTFGSTYICETKSVHTPVIYHTYTSGRNISYENYTGCYALNKIMINCVENRKFTV